MAVKSLGLKKKGEKKLCILFFKEINGKPQDVRSELV